MLRTMQNDNTIMGWEGPEGRFGLNPEADTQLNVHTNADAVRQEMEEYNKEWLKANDKKQETVSNGKNKPSKYIALYCDGQRILLTAFGNIFRTFAERPRIGETIVDVNKTYYKINDIIVATEDDGIVSYTYCLQKITENHGLEQVSE